MATKSPEDIPTNIDLLRCIREMTHYLPTLEDPDFQIWKITGHLLQALQENGSLRNILYISGRHLVCRASASTTAMKEREAPLPTAAQFHSSAATNTCFAAEVEGRLCVSLRSV
jgi:hypothetical protein